MTSKLEKYLDENYVGYSSHRYGSKLGGSGIFVHLKASEGEDKECVSFAYSRKEYDLFLSDRDLCDNKFDEINDI